MENPPFDSGFSLRFPRGSKGFRSHINHFLCYSDSRTISLLQYCVTSIQADIHKRARLDAVSDHILSWYLSRFLLTPQAMILV